MPLTPSAFVELSCPTAICRSPGRPDRGSAVRLLQGHNPLPLLNLPDLAAASATGRVHGLGRFFSNEAHEVLAAALPPPLRLSLRREFEWYGCRGAFFHSDAQFGEVLFGAWCAAGPPRDIVFARAGLRVPAAPGHWAIFDPFEPHAVLDAGAGTYVRQRYEGSAASIFVGFELGLESHVRHVFGIGPADPGAVLLSSNVAINAETGAVGRASLVDRP